ncbi:hypothetical protein TrCOL_g4571 [Triparma columacea]|uniref:Uncharacterized protein n=1 Tax=Triparma columacea TaxID=722753 RepID=A0A9W7GGZ0_9STRA|nr:hypothetical protein TrCOL_g4571 [Triparma columacea]
MTDTNSISLVVSPGGIAGVDKNGVTGGSKGSGFSRDTDRTTTTRSFCEALFGCFGSTNGRYIDDEIVMSQEMTEKAVEKYQKDVQAFVLKDTAKVREDIKAAVEVLKEEMQEMKKDVKTEVESGTEKVEEDLKAEVKALKEDMREMQKLLLGIREVLALPKSVKEEGGEKGVGGKEGGGGEGGGEEGGGEEGGLNVEVEKNKDNIGGEGGDCSNEGEDEVKTGVGGDGKKTNEKKVEEVYKTTSPKTPTQLRNTMKKGGNEGDDPKDVAGVVLKLMKKNLSEDNNSEGTATSPQTTPPKTPTQLRNERRRRAEKFKKALLRKAKEEEAMKEKSDGSTVGK